MEIKIEGKTKDPEKVEIKDGEINFAAGSFDELYTAVKTMNAKEHGEFSAAEICTMIESARATGDASTVGSVPPIGNLRSVVAHLMEQEIVAKKDKKVIVNVIDSEKPKPQSSAIILDASGKSGTEVPKPLLDENGKPFGKDNPPVETPPKEKFEPVPYNKPEKKAPKEAPEDLYPKLKALKEKVRDLNEKYFSATQREEKALL